MTSFWDNLRLSLGTFVSNPLRSLLTLLGIVIGVTTVIAMMSMIEGLRIKVNRDLSQLGANTFQVQKMPIGFGRFNWQKFAKRPRFSLPTRDDDPPLLPRRERGHRQGQHRGSENHHRASGDSRQRAGVVGDRGLSRDQRAQHWNRPFL